MKKTLNIKIIFLYQEKRVTFFIIKEMQE